MAGRHRAAESDDAGRRSRTLTIVAAVAVVVALAVILPLLLTGGDGSRTASAPGTTTTPATTSPPGTPTTPTTSPPATTHAGTPTRTTPAPRRTARKPPPDAPDLLVHADRGRSWLTVRDASGRRLFDGMVRPGDRRSFSGPYLSVVIGDAGAVDVVVQGTHRPRGGVGQVLRFAVRG